MTIILNDYIRIYISKFCPSFGYQKLQTIEMNIIALGYVTIYVRRFA